MSTIFILDQKESAESLAMALCQEGHVTYISYDYKKALRQIAELTAIKAGPVLVLAEFLETDGAELCRELRRYGLTRKIKVVLMSRGGPHSNIDYYRKLGASYGADDYLLKSDDLRAIARSIRHLI